MINIFWFRRDLRLEDNHALQEALRSNLPVLPIFIFDKNILDKLNDKEDPRVTFIHEEVIRISKELQKTGSSLKLFYDTPEKAMGKLCNEYEVNTVFANEDYEPYARERDEAIKKLLDRKGARLKLFKDQVILEKNEVVKENGDPYMVFTPYSKKWKEHFAEQHPETYDTSPYLHNFMPTDPFESIQLSDLGFRENSMDWPPRKIPVDIISKYDKTRDYPHPNGTSRMGLHLRFGTVSIRELVNVAANYNDTYLNELIWREFYMMILWHHPEIIDRSFKPEYDRIAWRNDESDFQAWCEGKTGYPMVDAGMRQLKESRYMHNRVRMVTASFLTKHLLIDWRWGEAWFASLLLDYEQASNNGGWQWAAGSGCDAAPYFRIFNPASQQKKFDPEMKYIKQWVPEIESEHYPEPIVQHSFARKRALETYTKTIKSN